MVALGSLFLGTVVLWLSCRTTFNLLQPYRAMGLGSSDPGLREFSRGTWGD